MKLSILVLTIPGRERTFQALIESLKEQTCGHADVEVLALYDNKTRTIGAKRNILLAASHGEYVTCVDDVERLIPALCTYQKGKLSGIKYEKLAVYLLKVVKEQELRIKKLENK